MTNLVSDPRLIRIYWFLTFHVDVQQPLYVEGYNEIGWQLGEHTLWCYLGERRTVHLWDSLSGAVVAPSRGTLKRRIQAFLGAKVNPP